MADLKTFLASLTRPIQLKDTLMDWAKNTQIDNLEHLLSGRTINGTMVPRSPFTDAIRSALGGGASVGFKTGAMAKALTSRSAIIIRGKDKAKVLPAPAGSFENQKIQWFINDVVIKISPKMSKFLKSLGESAKLFDPGTSNKPSTSGPFKAGGTIKNPARDFIFLESKTVDMAVNQAATSILKGWGFK